MWTTQQVTSTSSADIAHYLIDVQSESPGCNFMKTLLVSGVTTPILSFSQLLQQGYGCTMETGSTLTFLDAHFQIVS